MTRSTSSTVSTAVALNPTKPIYLIRMGFSVEQRIATWNASISWNSETWAASGAAVSSLNGSTGMIELPLDDSEAWLALVLNEAPAGKTITIYEHHTDTSASPVASDAVSIFVGIMDEMQIDNRIKIQLLESSNAKGFPFTSIDRPTYNYLPQSGTRITWGTDYVVVD